MYNEFSRNRATKEKVNEAMKAIINTLFSGSYSVNFIHEKTGITKPLLIRAVLLLKNKGVIKISTFKNKNIEILSLAIFD